MPGPESRLAAYGSLIPGGTNHHELAEFRGRWIEGTVRGLLRDHGWGADLGYPGIVLDPEGPHVPVHILESADLAARWDRLDAFEGPGYRRTVATATTAEGPMEVSIYQLSVDPASPCRGEIPTARRGRPRCPG